MALGQYVRDELAVILGDDDAIASKASYDDYTAAGFDERKLELKPGSTPTRFTLGRLTDDQRKHFDELLSGPERAEFALRCSLKRIDGYELRYPDGRVAQVTVPPCEPDPKFGPMLPAKWFKTLPLAPSHMLALTAIVRFVLSEASLPFPKD